MPSVEQTDFNARSHRDFSLGEDKLLEYKNGRNWPTMSVERYQLRCLALRNVLSAQSDVAKLKKHWLSLLVPPGTMLVRKAPTGGDGACVRGRWVLATNEFGCMLWELQGVHSGHWMLFRPAPYEAGGAAVPVWTHFPIAEHDKLQVMHVKTLPPTVVKKNVTMPAESQPWHRGVLLCVDKRVAPEPLMTAAAKYAFNNLSCDQMNDLIDLAEIQYEGPKPRLEADLAALLIRSQLPGISDTELADIMLHRGSKKQQAAHPTVLAEENVKTVHGIIEADEANVAVQELGEEKKLAGRSSSGPASSTSSATATASAAASGSAATSSASPGAAAASGPRGEPKPVPPGDYTVDEARELMPKVKKAWIGIHTGRAWQVKYPKATYPKSHTCAWAADGGEPTYWQALRECLLWAWECYAHDFPGEKCPHAF